SILVRTGGLLTPSRPVRPDCSTRLDHRTRRGGRPDRLRPGLLDRSTRLDRLTGPPQTRRGGRPVHPASLPDRSTQLLTRLFTGPVHGTRPDRLRPGLLDRRLRPVRLKLGHQPDRLHSRPLLPLPIQPKQPRRPRPAPAELGHQLVAARLYTQPLLKRGDLLQCHCFCHRYRRGCHYCVALFCGWWAAGLVPSCHTFLLCDDVTVWHPTPKSRAPWEKQAVSPPTATPPSRRYRRSERYTRVTVSRERHNPRHACDTISRTASKSRRYQPRAGHPWRSEEHTSELQSREN